MILKQDRPVACAVDDRRVLHRLVDRHQEVASDDDVEDLDRYRQDENQTRVDETEAADQQIRGDETAAEEQGHQINRRDWSSERQVAFGKRIGSGERHQQGGEGAEYHAKNGVEIGQADVFLPEHESKRLEPPVVDPDVQPELVDLFRGRERLQDDSPEGVDEGQGEQEEERDVGEVEQPAADGFSSSDDRHDAFLPEPILAVASDDLIDAQHEDQPTDVLE